MMNQLKMRSRGVISSLAVRCSGENNTAFGGKCFKLHVVCICKDDRWKYTAQHLNLSKQTATSKLADILSPVQVESDNRVTFLT